MSVTVPEMTERQAKAWAEFVAEAQTYVSTSTIPVDYRSWDWATRWQDEVRPGRGQDMSAVWHDGEYVVQILCDVYGNGSVAVGETNWLHNGADEECDCERCEAQRKDEDDG